MSVRAAAGVFYGSITGNAWNTTADNEPFVPYCTRFRGQGSHCESLRR